jgi:hypothetical protein
MNLLDSKLPLLLRSAGLAFIAVFFAAAGLSLDNPVSLVLLLVAGLAGGLIVYSAGVVVERTLETAEGQRQSHADIRAQTKAMLELVEGIREASTED